MTVAHRRLMGQGVGRSLPLLGVTLLAAVLASGTLAAGRAPAPVTQRGGTVITLPGTALVDWHAGLVIAAPAPTTPARVPPAVGTPALVGAALGDPTRTVPALGALVESTVGCGAVATAPRALVRDAVAPWAGTPQAHTPRALARHTLAPHALAARTLTLGAFAAHPVVEAPPGPWSPEIAPDRPVLVAAAVTAVGRVLRAPSGPRAPPAVAA